MDILPIAFPPSIGTKPEWTPYERGIGTSIAQACLLSPRSRRKRERYVTGLLFNRLESIFEVGDRDLARVVLQRVISDPRDFGKLSPISDYMDRLHFRVPGRKERSRSLLFVRNIIAVGLTLKILVAASLKDRRKLTLDDAQRELSEQFGYIVGNNEAYPREAWFKWRHAAHLCAAVVDYLPKHLKVDENFWQEIEDDLPNFLATAIIYQRFLVAQYNEAGRSLSRQMLQDLQLLTIPDTICVGPAPRYSIELPRWRKKASDSPE